MRLQPTSSLHSLSLPRFLTPKPLQITPLQRRKFVMTSTSPKEPRRFAPFKKGAERAEGVRELKGIVFDVDGTLCLQQNYMFAEMRSILGITKGTDILDHCHSLPQPQQEEALEAVRAVERKAMVDQKPQPGLVELSTYRTTHKTIIPALTYLTALPLPKAICTRNFPLPVSHLLTSFLPNHHFSPIVTREFRPPKPHPAGILHIAKSLGIDASDMIMVGDSIDDMTAGHHAGTATVLLVNPDNAHLATHEHTDLCISRLDELIPVLENGFVGRGG
ncbi:hypothetical protein HYFRA_00004209 [Hymenoscyphus fraxineus]|uniref:HAD superfamily hydrolase n=1 Tax=Hymenoscyphus fraxineus TaxID=746836 RepID=A0A9N9PKG9_9HELO|nr:hypothetical protein HYFRA_00004209 [Hymenoscyphus fraxineus]